MVIPSLVAYWWPIGLVNCLLVAYWWLIGGLLVKAGGAQGGVVGHRLVAMAAPDRTLALPHPCAAAQVPFSAETGNRQLTRPLNRQVNRPTKSN